MLSLSSKSHYEESKEEGGYDARNVLKPFEKRHFTDFIFAIAILALWITMTAVGAVSFADGNPYRLVSPVDDDVRALCNGNSRYEIVLLSTLELILFIPFSRFKTNLFICFSYIGKYLWRRLWLHRLEEPVLCDKDRSGTLY